MSESYVIIRYVAPSEATVRRVLFYLENDSRPAFEDEVPRDEINTFKAFEFAPIPWKIKMLNAVTFEAWFENIDMSDMEEMMLAFDGSSLKGCYSHFSDDEEYKAYFTVRNGKLKRIYRIEKDRELDKKLWELDWGTEALSLIIERFA